MDAESTHYRTLGVAPDAPPAVIRAAYVALSKIHHPDGGTDPDQRRMQDINRAWAALRDPARRKDYDAALARATRARAAHARARTDAGGGGGGGASRPRPDTRPAPGRRGWGEGGGGARARPRGPGDDPTPAGGTPGEAGGATTPPPGRPRARFRTGGDDPATAAGPPRPRARFGQRARRAASDGDGDGGAGARRPPGRGRWRGGPRTPPQGQAAIDDDDLFDPDEDTFVDEPDEPDDGPGAGAAGWGEEVDDPDDWDTEGDERDPTAVTARRVVAFGLDLAAVGVVAYGLWRILVFAAYEDVPKPDRAQARDVCTYVADTTADCHVFGTTAYFHTSYWPIAVAVLVPLVLVHVVMQGRTGATPGKALMGLRTVKEDGAPPGYTRATVRTALLLAVDTAVWCVPIVGITQVRSTIGHRRIGDRVARTYVVGLRSVGRPIVVPPPLPPPPARQH